MSGMREKRATEERGDRHCRGSTAFDRLRPRACREELAEVRRQSQSPLIRCKKTVEEGVLCELRCRVKVEKRHDLRFMKLDGLG